jgi:hypothetical protein
LILLMKKALLNPGIPTHGPRSSCRSDKQRMDDRRHIGRLPKRRKNGTRRMPYESKTAHR